jgi:hypothetical protein
MAITFTEIRDVQAEEENGRVVSLTRRGRIRGLTSPGAKSYVDQILSSSAVPGSGSSIVANGSTLRLVKRTPVIDDDSGLGTALVDLLYERQESSTSDGGGGGGGDDTPTLEGGTSLKRVQTNRNRDGTPLKISYEWPAGTKGVMADGVTPRDGAVEKQGGKISVLVPMSSVFGSFTFATNSPGAITQEYAGHVNSVTWQGGAPRTWMCTDARFKLVDDSVSPPIYRLRFEFEYDELTWDNDTTLAFIDVDTRRPPPDVDDSVNGGLKVIQYYPEKDFNEDFG